MFGVIQRRSLSPRIRAEMEALGLLASRRALGPPVVLSIALVDIAATVLSLINP